MARVSKPFVSLGFFCPVFFSAGCVLGSKPSFLPLFFVSLPSPCCLICASHDIYLDIHLRLPSPYIVHASLSLPSSISYTIHLVASSSPLSLSPIPSHLMSRFARSLCLSRFARSRYCLVASNFFYCSMTRSWSRSRYPMAFLVL